MSFPLSSPSGGEEYKEEYLITKLTMPPPETGRRRISDLSKISEWYFC